jgi:hypothetical protein
VSGPFPAGAGEPAAADVGRSRQMAGFSPGQLAELACTGGAVDAAVWGKAAVNYEVMRSVMAADGDIEFVYWSKLRP